MTPKDLRWASPLFEEFADRFTPLLVDDQRTESRKERAKAYLRGLLLDAESTKTAESIALKVHGDPSQVRMTQVFLGQSAGLTNRSVRNWSAGWTRNWAAKRGR